MKFLYACLFLSALLNIVLALWVGFLVGKEQAVKKLFEDFMKKGGDIG